MYAKNDLTLTLVKSVYQNLWQFSNSKSKIKIAAKNIFSESWAIDRHSFST